MFGAFGIIVWFLVAWSFYDSQNKGRIAIAVAVAASLLVPALVGGPLAGSIGFAMRTLVAVAYLIKRQYVAATW